MDVEQETALTLLQRNTKADQSNVSANISVVSRDGNYLNVGTCVLPNSGAAWPIPRTETDVDLLHRASRSRFSLADYGYLPRIGGFVWNRDERPTYISAAMAKRNRGRTAVPLLWSSDIRPDGILRFDGKRKANGEPCFVSLGSKTHSYVVRNPSVVLQRVTSNDQPRRLVAAVVPQALLDEHGGFVGENHTVILERVRQDAVLSPEQMVALLSLSAVDRYFRCISGATNVSIFELTQLALPDPKKISSLLQRGLSMAQAVTEVLGDNDDIGARVRR
jgi:adenine-specific DNA-methyltransferase